VVCEAPDPGHVRERSLRVTSSGIVFAERARETAPSLVLPFRTRPRLPIDTMMEKVSPQVRILAVVLVLVGTAGMLALRMLGPNTSVDVAPAPVPVVATARAAKVKAQPVKPAATRATAVPSPVRAAPQEPALNAPPIPATGFPKAVDAALAKHEVLVVSLVVPGARVDELAAAEARSGAKLAGAGYLALNVLNDDVARALLSKFDVVQNPSVLVLKRSGEIALELSGFADRETVAQAAANASP